MFVSVWWMRDVHWRGGSLRLPGRSSPGRTIIQLGKITKLDDRGWFSALSPSFLICLASAKRFLKPLSENPGRVKQCELRDDQEDTNIVTEDAICSYFARRAKKTNKQQQKQKNLSVFLYRFALDSTKGACNVFIDSSPAFGGCIVFSFMLLPALDLCVCAHAHVCIHACSCQGMHMHMHACMHDLWKSLAVILQVSHQVV